MVTRKSHENIESSAKNGKKSLLFPAFKERIHWFMRSLMRIGAESLWMVIATSNCCKIEFGHFFDREQDEYITCWYRLEFHRSHQCGKVFLERTISRNGLQHRNWTCLTSAQPRLSPFDFHFWEVALNQVHLKLIDWSLCVLRPRPV